MLSKINIHRGTRGFTLVELLVVIAIIGILATLLLLQLGVGRQKARDARRIVDVNQIRTASELYFDDNGSYPTTLSGTLVPKYLTLLPVDPLSGAAYGYSYSAASSPTKYQVWAELEAWAQALNSDADINSTTGGWSGSTINGGTDAKTNCTSTANDCIYDQGQNI